MRSTTTGAASVTVAPKLAVREICSKVLELRHLACIYQTGKFPVQSRSGNNYLLMLCDYDVNAILSEPIPNRKTETLQEATLKFLAQVNKKSTQTY